MNPSLNVYDTEIVKIIKQLHKSQREVWKKQEEGKIKEYNKKQHVALRRDQVRNLLSKIQNISIHFQ